MTPFDYICVIDFECTCSGDREKSPLRTSEIIEFVIVIIDVKRKAIKTIYHTYVKPELDPKLSEFCKELTGITQEQVDSGITIKETLR